MGFDKIPCVHCLNTLIQESDIDMYLITGYVLFEFVRLSYFEMKLIHKMKYPWLRQGFIV